MKRFSDLPERWQKVILVVCTATSVVVPVKLLDLLPIPLEYYSRAYPFRAKLVGIAFAALSLALLLAPLWTDHLIGKRIERRRRLEQAAADLRGGAPFSRRRYGRRKRRADRAAEKATDAKEESRAGAN